MAYQPSFKSRSMLKVERRLGRAMEEFLAERYQVATQRQIAEELGLDVSTISRWMRDLDIEARFPGQSPPAEHVA